MKHKGYSFDGPRKSNRLKEANASSKDQCYIPSSPSSSTSTVYSRFDSPFNDPSYEASDPHTSEDNENSEDSCSDSDELFTAQRSGFSHNTILSNRKVYDNIRDQSPKHSESIVSKIDKNFNAENQIPHDPIFNLERHNESQKVKQFQLSTYMKGKRFGKKRTSCKFCESSVTNFERHLERHHKDCKDVKDMFKYPKKSDERKKIIQLIRNEGNFHEFLKGNVKPVYEIKDMSKDDYGPCPYCKGVYRKSYIHRHYKKCTAADVRNDPSKIKHLSASQTLIASAMDTNHVIDKLRVKNEVFSIMRADQISMVAKTDTLIYLYGEKYLKKHERKQMAVVCSNKMRELARLLIEIRNIENNPNFALVDTIEPEMFEKVVECVKRIGGYDIETNSYKKSASLAAYYGTTLKSVCDVITYIIATKKTFFNFHDPEAKYNAVSRFKELITSQWTTEISSLAFKDLNEKKWSKPVMLPLTKDIIKFKEYVTEVANKAAAFLKHDPHNAQEYKKLVNATLTLTILYNRRRTGDVQYTKLLTYLNNASSSNQQEFLNSLSESEKVLTKHYKRVVTGGKGCRPTVTLFPQRLQDLINVMLEVRTTSNLVPDANEFLFAHPNSSQWIRGGSIISQFAKKCGLKHPEHMTSNKLRKQIATVLQVLNLSHDEVDQFAQFMGHTGETHDDFYKLSEDVYQTAKVSKLLILMDKGIGHKYKGKSLNEIDINPEVDVAESENEIEEPSLQSSSELSISNIIPVSPKPSSSSNEKRSKQSGRTPWSPEQIQLAKKYFNNHIKQCKAPNKDKCRRLIDQHPNLFYNKDWVRIKTFIYNTYRKK